MESGAESPRISVRNIQRKVRMDMAELQGFAGRAVEHCLKLRKGKRTELSRLRQVFVWLISDRRMAALHQKFLGQAGPTDVLTFQHGEIFIGVETARRQARVFGNSLMRELKRYIIHGLLHLHGFDDQTPIEARRMKTTQEKILHRTM